MNRTWKSYEHGIELDGIFIATAICQQLKPGDLVHVVEFDGRKYLLPVDQTVAVVDGKTYAVKNTNGPGEPGPRVQVELWPTP